MAPLQYLTEAQVAAFARDGMVVLPDFYEPDEIVPIQRAIYGIIGLVIQKYGLRVDRKPFDPETFDDGYQALLAANRSYASEVYDAVKQIPAFVRLTANAKHDAVFAQLRNTDLPGVAAGGYGIRIDNPFEDKFRANWHQDYHAQLRSIDGLVFWSSLVRMTPEMGPVIFALGSHHDGPVPVWTRDPRNKEKTAAYALVLDDEEGRIARYPQIAPLSKPGDLIVLDYLVLHASGENRGARSRWSMQMRYFNFRHPSGVKLGWRGAYAAGNDLRSVHPELVLD